MIISASRRTDIPAYYGAWFMERLRAGFCDTINPYDPAKKRHISLKREEVDCIAFWTRYPAGLFPFLDELSGLGYPYYFLYTLLDYPPIFEPHTPVFNNRLRLFRELANKIGSGKVIWRYDPIILTSKTGTVFHLQTFDRLARLLEGYTKRVIISFYDPYRKTEKRIKILEKNGYILLRKVDSGETEVAFLQELARIAALRGMEITSCAEENSPEQCGIIPGSCIDADLILREFGIPIPYKKDPGQRKHCRCVISADIGSYNTCFTGCAYCYATSEHPRKLR
ncbi:MAG: DUF1848 domain-containing protein [Spirochaetota bacterium]